MTITFDRPTSRTARLASAVEVASSLLGATDYSGLPDLHAVDISADRGGVPEVRSLIVGSASGVLAWHRAVPGARASVSPAPHHGTDAWYGTVTATIAGVAVNLWTLVYPSAAQVERLERQPEAAYAVLVELAGGAR